MRRRPNLFEVINREPQQHVPRPLPGLSRWLRRTDSDPMPPIVAEPLTEEQAAAELAAQRAAAEEAARAREQAIQEKQARIEAKREAKAARKEARRLARQAARSARTEADDLNIAAPILRRLPGRLLISLNTASCIIVAAGICSIAIGAYSLGRRAALNPQTELSKVAAVKNGGAATNGLAALVPGLDNEGKAAGKAGQTSATGDPDLSALLNKPGSVTTSNARANQPATVATGPSGPAAMAARLNYLQIESFPKTRNQSDQQLRADLEKVRRFLAERGIKSFAREMPRSYVLFAAQGFSPSSDASAQREALQRKISRLGQEYRQAGGRYEFRGCFFVSYAKATAGQPA